MMKAKNSMGITYKYDNNLDDAFEVRRVVFMEEQGFKNEFEDSDHDPNMIHVTAYEDGKLAGCARVFPSSLEPNYETEEGLWVFGRLAVLPEARKKGLGSKILTAAESIAVEHGASSMVLHAQCVAQPFYNSNGYEAFGPIEFDEHVEHQWMRKNLI